MEFDSRCEMVTVIEEEDIEETMNGVKRLLRWKPMVLFLRFGVPLIGAVYLLYVAFLIRSGDLILEVWFL